MAWFGGQNWSQLKGQLSEMTKDLLTETTQETEDPETELAVTRSRLLTIETQNVSLRAEVDQLSTKIQVAELRATEDGERLRKSEEQVRKLTAQLESVKLEKQQLGNDETSRSNFSGIVDDDESPSVEATVADEWHERSAVSGDDALEQARAEADYWRMVANSNQSEHQRPDSSDAKSVDDLEQQVQEYEKQLHEERTRRELEIVAIRELYERRLADAEAQIAEVSQQPTVAFDTPQVQLTDAEQQTDGEATLVIPPQISSSEEKATLTDDNNASCITHQGSITDETLLTEAVRNDNHQRIVAEIHKNFANALQAKDLATLSSYLQVTSDLLLSADFSKYENVPEQTFKQTGNVWKFLSMTKSESATSTGNDFDKVQCHTDTQTHPLPQKELSHVYVQCENLEEEPAIVQQQNVTTKPLAELVECSCQTESFTDESAETVAKLEKEITSTKAERDHFSAAAHQQHNEAVRLFEEVGKWRTEVERLRNHLVQMENEYTAAAVASEQREKELRDKLAVSSESGPALESAVRERNEISMKLANAESETKRLSKQIIALQTALDQLQHNAENQFSIERDRMQKEVYHLKRDLDHARLKAAESTANIERVRQLTEQLAVNENDMNLLKTELNLVNDERMKSMTMVSELKASLADSLERRIVKGLVAACLHTPQGQRQHEALNTFAKVVGLTEEEAKKAAVTTRQSSGSPGQPGGGLGELFVKFLEAESSENAATKLRLSLAPVGPGSPARSAPTTPSSLIGRLFSSSQQTNEDATPSSVTSRKPSSESNNTNR